MTGLHTDAYRRFIAIMVETRRAAGVTQYELADRLGVDQSYVSKYENGRQRLDVVEFLRITQALRCDPRPILDGVLSEGDLKR